MLEQISPLWDVYLKHKKNGQALVLVTLVNTTGSSYKKAGAMMLIEADQTTHGLISGGCLEADVAEHSMAVFQTGKAIKLEYDLSDESIFGLGAGCDGSIQLVLQLLTGDYLPFSGLNPLPDQAKDITLQIQSNENDEFPLGSFYLSSEDTLIEYPTGFFVSAHYPEKALRYQSAPKIAICGAGVDVIPLIKLLHLLHWHIYLIDHRSGRLNQALYHPNTQMNLVSMTTLNTSIKSENYDAVIIMSHNLEHDAAYLNYFVATEVPWIGLLGPKRRRDKVLKKAGINIKNIKAQLHAPVGLDLGGQMPENIAVSIVAQLQQHIYQK